MNVSKPRVSVLRVRQGRAGLLLVAVGWPLHWLLPGVQSVYLFFPLWLGYILAVGALVFTRAGISMLTRSGTKAGDWVV